MRLHTSASVQGGRKGGSGFGNENEWLSVAGHIQSAILQLGPSCQVVQTMQHFGSKVFQGCCMFVDAGKG